MAETRAGAARGTALASMAGHYRDWEGKKRIPQ
jgi:hypothetical protein